AHGSENLSSYTSSSSEIIAAASRLFDRIINPALLIRRAYLTACSVLPEDTIPDRIIQRDLFDNPEETEIMEKENEEAEKRERRFQETALSIKRKFGKNSILRGLDYEEGATARERNNQIGGHKA
ncbi:MAG: DNA methylase, partial [Spirochaetes bacterium]|nr:DNA methylase [Candidatus Ornithospirochaeta stercoravium]